MSGEYRVFFCVTQDTPEFQALSGRAQNAWRALKLKLPPTGISVLYPAELTPRMGADATSESADAAIVELIEHNFVRREGPVLWLVTALGDDPFMRASSDQTRWGVQKRVASLPRCQLVEMYKAHYAEWFIDDRYDESPAKPTRGPARGGSNTSGSGPTHTSRTGVSKGVSKGPASKVPRDRMDFADRSAEQRVRHETPIDTPTYTPNVQASQEACDEVSDAPSMGASIPFCNMTSVVVDVVGSSETARANNSASIGSTSDPAGQGAPRVPLGAVIRKFPTIAAWIEGRAERRDVLRRALSRVMALPGAERNDCVTYVGMLNGALDGMNGRSLTAEQAEMNLVDWCTKRNDAGELPRVDPRTFRRYLMGDDTTMAQKAAARGQGRRGPARFATGEPRTPIIPVM